MDQVIVNTPSPLDAYKYVKDYDKRIGLCIDIGHSVRWGDDEIEVIHAVKDRLYDFHIKDTTAREESGSTVELGRGIINIPGVIKALMDIQFDGHVALEYEKDADNPLPGMRECFGYIRGCYRYIKHELIDKPVEVINSSPKNQRKRRAVWGVGGG